jgi:hypothetical protein
MIVTHRKERSHVVVLKKNLFADITTEEATEKRTKDTDNFLVTVGR